MCVRLCVYARAAVVRCCLSLCQWYWSFVLNQIAWAQTIPNEHSWKENTKTGFGSVCACVCFSFVHSFLCCSYCSRLASSFSLSSIFLSPFFFRSFCRLFAVRYFIRLSNEMHAQTMILSTVRTTMAFICFCVLSDLRSARLVKFMALVESMNLKSNTWFRS